MLGGTFDPIHVGHLAAASAAVDCAHLDRVILVPSASPPHRSAAVAPTEDRLAMCRLAIEGEPRFEVSDIEVRRGGRSYTVDTLLDLRRLLPDDEIFLILGWDAAKLFGSWRDPDRVAAEATLVIVARPRTEPPGTLELKAAHIDPARAVLCLRPTPDVAASSLRRAIAGGESIDGKVSPAVARYIAAHHLYTDNR